MTLADIRARVANEARVLTVPIELRANASAPAGTIASIAGYAAVFDTLSHDLGGFREKIARGAFRKVVARGGDIPLVHQHDSRLLLAATDAGTLALTEDPKGLHVEADIVDTSHGRDAVKLLETRHLREMSFMFTVPPDGDTWEQAQDGSLIRTVTEVGDLFDVSIVRGPAYPGTDVSLRMRPASDSELAMLGRALTKFGVQPAPSPDETTVEGEELTETVTAEPTTEEVVDSDPTVVGDQEERQLVAAQRRDHLRRQKLAAQASTII